MITDTKDIKKDMEVNIEPLEEFSLRGKPAPEENQVMLLAALIESEASGESYYGMCAVGAVVMNRMKDGKGLKEVIFEKGQFCGIKRKSFKERKASSRAIEAAYTTLSGERVLGKEYLYFLNRRSARSKEMLFKLESCPMAIEIGAHSFFY